MNKRMETKKIEYLEMFTFQNKVSTGEFKYMGIIEISSNLKLNNFLEKTEFNYNIERELTYFLTENIEFYKCEINSFILISKLSFEENEIFLEELVDSFSQCDIRANIGLTDIFVGRIEEAMLTAEIALEVSKQIDKDFFLFQENHEKVKEVLEDNLSREKTKHLIYNDLIVPFFQPILCLETGVIKKYEVLARGKLGVEIISPFVFIKHSEKLDLILDLTRTIIRKSFKYFKNNDFEFSINITERDLKDSRFIPFLEKELIKNRIDPERVILEILENITFSEDSNLIKQRLQELKNIGFKLAIDDFGSDKSNFSRLLDTNCDFLKIDAIFIKNIHKNHKNLKIVKSIVSMAKVLKMKTVAEFVENEDILEILKEIGVDYAQGYHIGKPLEHTL